MTSFPRPLNNNTINNQAEADCLGKHFSLSEAEYIILHARECDHIALLCSDSKIRVTGVRRVCLQTLHTHTFVYRHQFEHTIQRYHTSDLQVNYTAAQKNDRS